MSQQSQSSSTSSSSSTFTSSSSANQSSHISQSSAQSTNAPIELEYLNRLQKKQDDLEKNIKQSREELNNIKNEIKNQSSRNIEVIGIFSSVLALLIINVNIVLAAVDILSAIILIIGLTSSISIFALLIHKFFSTGNSIAFDKYFWIPIGILSSLLIVGILVEANVFKLKDLNKKEKPKEEIIINNNIEGQKNKIINSSDTLKTPIKQHVNIY
ncbi:hypothetical protein [Marinifilum fragile]|uniref:hypothetical protein n=1 Tax=Marinifilum fragile TaxID=570161 RepID=UPI002AA61037|nr:hypothetical protein [Marinifilum fragile]